MYRKCNAEWLDLSSNTNVEYRVNEISKIKLDLLVETSGRGEGNQLEILKYKPAKKIMSWLGYGYSTGLSNIDYFLTDSILLSDKERENFIEKSILAIDSPFTIYRPIIEFSDYPSPFIKNNFITFGYVSRSIRLNNLMIDAIARILSKNPNSKIQFNYLDYNFVGMQNLVIGKFAKFGITRDRIMFEFDSPIDKAFSKIDIYLDSFPHNSGTTIIEALYCGVPVVSLENDHVMGRVGKSILFNIDRLEWVATTVDTYVDIANKLSRDQEGLIYCRNNLKSILKKSNLMDYPKFAKKFIKSLD